MPITYPSVNPNDVKGFAQAWDCNGIKMILDNTSLRFAVDFANIVLRSYIDDLRAKAALTLKAKQAATSAAPTAELPAPVPAPEPAKSSIILTDC
jgi:hypothetical protein